ncbi:MAG: hypothetical protein R3Y46_08360 [Opitutales bacterium]
MKKSVFIALLVSFGTSLFAKEELRLDASSEKSLLSSFSAMSMKLPPATRQDLSNASAMIMYYASAMQFPKEKLQEIYDRKTAQQLIDIAQSYCPATRDTTYKLKAKDKTEFSDSFIVMLMNLPIEDQRQFSQIIAEVMMLAKLNKVDEEKFLKELDGMTGKEIIARFAAVKKSAEASKAPTESTKK